MKLTKLIISFAVLASTANAQTYPFNGMLTAAQVDNQVLGQQIGVEVQHRLQVAQSDPLRKNSICQAEIAQQVVNQYMKAYPQEPHEGIDQIDPRQNLPAMAAQAIEEKLDSIVTNYNKYYFVYDSKRQLVLEMTEYNLSGSSWAWSKTLSFEYNESNYVSKRIEKSPTSEYIVELKYCELSGFVGVTELSEISCQYNVITGDMTSVYGTITRREYVTNDHLSSPLPYTVYEGFYDYDKSCGFYVRSATEYEYANLENFTIDDSFSRYVCKSIYYKCPFGSFELVPVSSYEQVNRGYVSESYLDGRWLLTGRGYFDDAGITYTEETYSVDSEKSVYLSYFHQEERFGWSNYYNNRTRRRLELIFDSSGEITYGQKEEHLHGWGEIDYEIDHYLWDTTAGEWVLHYADYRGNNPYEGKRREIVEYPAVTSYTEQIYHDGSWVTTAFWGTLEYEVLGSLLDNNFSYRTYRTLSYSIDYETGDYTSYDETFYTYENNRLAKEESYDKPKQAHLSSRIEFAYTAEGEPTEEIYYKEEGGNMVLESRRVYEYDPEIGFEQVLNSNNSAVNPNSGYYYSMHSFGQCSKKPLCTKIYNADGSLREIETMYYYSPLNGGNDQGIYAPIMSEGPGQNYYNLMGQPISNPHGMYIGSGRVYAK